MFRTSISPRSQIIAAVVAIAFTVAIHGGWLSGMDRDAVAITQQA